MATLGIAYFSKAWADALRQRIYKIDVGMPKDPSSCWTGV
jgi:hypothetical protein